METNFHMILRKLMQIRVTGCDKFIIIIYKLTNR